MKTTHTHLRGLFLIAAVLLTAVAIPRTIHAQDTETPVVHHEGFVDADGDGYNDNAPDADGDGIPNGQDSDYTPAGTGAGNGHGRRFVDEDGDGFNDNAPDADGDGIPNGQDSDYTPQGKAAHGSAGEGHNGTGAKNGLRAFGKEGGHRNGAVTEAGEHVRGAGESLGGNGTGMQRSQSGVRIHAAE